MPVCADPRYPGLPGKVSLSGLRAVTSTVFSRIGGDSMPVAIGEKLGPYEILSPLGAGGMGEVYRASDTRLNRIVAIKVSKEQFSERFEREARAIAALNHPNICQIYDVGPNYIVMEYIEGESPHGPMPLDEALQIARQIADALEAAHEQGHRPSRPQAGEYQDQAGRLGQGAGLRAGEGVTTSATDSPTCDSPTMLASGTRLGVILGTAAYMSPEQARGQGGRQARGHLGVRRGAVRDAHGPQAVYGRRPR